MPLRKSVLDKAIDTIWFPDQQVNSLKEYLSTINETCDPDVSLDDFMHWLKGKESKSDDKNTKEKKSTLSTSFTTAYFKGTTKCSKLFDALRKSPDTIPRKIHFIWVGGPIKEEYLNSINSLLIAAKNGNFEVNLWVDNEDNYTWVKKKDHLGKEHKMFNKATDYTPSRLKIRNIEELKPAMQKDPIYKDDNFDFYWNCVHKEMIGLNNLAAASDILRYEILRQEGGYYFDTDSIFHVPQQMMQEKLRPNSAPYRFIIAGSHYNRSNGEFFLTGNDIFAAAPNHPILQSTLACVMKSYREYSQENLDRKRKYYPNFHSDRLNLTLYLTGPPVLTNFIDEHIKNENINDTNKIFFTFKSKKNIFNTDKSNATITKTSTFDVLGAKVESHSAGTWVKSNRLPRYFEEPMPLVIDHKQKLQSYVRPVEKHAEKPPKSSLRSKRK